MSAEVPVLAGAFEGRCHACEATIVMFREFDAGPALPDLDRWHENWRFTRCYVCGGQVTWIPAPNPACGDRTLHTVMRAIADEARSHDRRGECVCRICCVARDLDLMAGAR